MKNLYYRLKQFTRKIHILNLKKNTQELNLDVRMLMEMNHIHMANG